MTSDTIRISRRAALVAGALACAVPARGDDTAMAPARLVRARRPKPPYRVWFQPRLYERDVDLYQSMTIDASGWLDPRLTEPQGVTALDWVYGLNHPDATGPEYWQNACTERARGRPRQAPRFIAAGIAVDEWVPPALPQNEQWLCAGLRAGRRAHPDLFISIWSTDPTPALLELAKEGTCDLVIVEGYTHSVEPGLTTSWEGALKRMDAFADAGVMAKTIFSFGHITDRADSRGGHWKGTWLREKAEEIKRRYPTSPGIAFFQSTDPETPELRELIRLCDGLSGELWPA